jgi:hypothetical protein
MSTARTSASESSVSRSISCSAVVRIGLRSSDGGLLEAAAEKLRSVAVVNDVSVSSYSDVTPKKGNITVTVDVDVVIPQGVDVGVLKEQADDVLAVESLLINE